MLKEAVVSQISGFCQLQDRRTGPARLLGTLDNHLEPLCGEVPKVWSLPLYRYRYFSKTVCLQTVSKFLNRHSKRFSVILCQLVIYLALISSEDDKHLPL